MAIATPHRLKVPTTRSDAIRMPIARGTLLLAAVVAALLAAAGPATAASRTAFYDTFLLSRSVDGGLPDAPSTGGVISQDGRIAQTAAFQSDATNLVAGDTNALTDVFLRDRGADATNIVANDTNGVTDVFMVQRAAGYTQDGSPWAPSPTRLVSQGMGGQPANGPSYGPAISGDASSSKGSDSTPPNCIAFVSRASNLVPGDTNGRADAFVYWLSSGKIERVSVSSTGRQSNGDTYGVAVDGTCERIGFTSDATNLAQTDRGGKRTPNFGDLKTRKASTPVKQVYVHVPRATRASSA